MPENNPESNSANPNEAIMLGPERQQPTGPTVGRLGVNLFAVYAKIFRLMLAKTIDRVADDEEEYARELEGIVLPSNEDWRLRVYYRLVELQRETDAKAAQGIVYDLDDDGDVPCDPNQNAPWDWEPILAGGNYPLRASDPEAESGVQPQSKWSIEDLLLAAQLLELPTGDADSTGTNRQRQPEYPDEAGMRRVYALVFDVLRYRHILEKALEDTGFWRKHRQARTRKRVVWLLLYDLQDRKFARNCIRGSPEERERREALNKAGLLVLEQALAKFSTRLAASLSRLRIAGSALSLEGLLPEQLRRPRLAVVSGWAHPGLYKWREDLEYDLSCAGLRRVSANTGVLAEDEFTFDPVCPRVVNLHERGLQKLQGPGLVLLARSLCLGAAAIAQAMRTGRLCGPVVLTHPLAPRHTAYLATLLAEVPAAGRLLAFGLGNRLLEYQGCIEELGLARRRCVLLFAEEYIDAIPFPELERATVVLGMPPCSRTGVRDAVDLAVARGGDLHLLEALSNSQHTSAHAAQQSREHLAQQISTLKHALTRPNVQLLIYEAQSIFPAETTDMLQRTLEHANGLARDKYVKENPRKKVRSRTSKSKHSKSKSQQHREHPSSDEHSIEPEEAPWVPDSDVFEAHDLSYVFEGFHPSYVDPGSFVVLVRRKELMQFDSLFMIRVAEAKGVFGTKQPPVATPEEPPPPPEPQPVSLPEERGRSRRRKRAQRPVQELLQSLGAPTYASAHRLEERPSAGCPRREKRLAEEDTMRSKRAHEALRSDAKCWWRALGRAVQRDVPFRVLRTDPATRRTIFPARILPLSYEPDSEAVASSSRSEP